MSTLNAVLRIIVKLIALAFSPVVIALILVFWLLSFLIDLLAKKSDEEHLSERDVRKRNTDRTNKRRHSVLDLIFDYFKALFSW